MYKLKFSFIYYYYYLFILFFCSRTPGSRQPSPAEETLPRPPTLLDPTQHGGFPTHPFNHMLNSMDHQGGQGTQMNSYPPHQMQMGQLHPPVMNGVGGMQMAQVLSNVHFIYTFIVL